MITNADGIRRMSDEELAERLCSLCRCHDCVAHDYCYLGHSGFIDWLKEEADEMFKYQRIAELQPADIQPVAKGEWIWDIGENRFVCSECGCFMPTDNGFAYLNEDDNHFCYTCGADMRKVSKTKWKLEFAGNGWANHICPECGWTMNTDIHVQMDYNFCPNCGTDMRGVDNG